MAVDETAKSHEKWLGNLYDFGLEHTVWAIYYAISALLLLAIGIKPLRDLFRVYPRQCRIMLVGAVIFFTGGVVLEYLGNFLRDDETTISSHRQINRCLTNLV